jgi:hypothetical protein
MPLNKEVPSIRSSGQGSELLFSLPVLSLRQTKPFLEGCVIFVNHTPDYYLCTLNVKPFAIKVVDFHNSFWLPSLGEVFLVPLSAWNKGPRPRDFIWPARRRTPKFELATVYDRLIKFTKFNAYSLAVSFKFRTYRFKLKEIFFPLKKKKRIGYCYPTLSRQSFFLPRNLHRSLARHRFLGFNGLVALLVPVLFTSRHSLLGPTLRLSGCVLPLLFSYASSCRIFLLYRFLRSCSSRQIRKFARMGLAKLVHARHRTTLSSTVLLPAFSLNSLKNVSSTLSISRTTAFSYYLLGAVVYGGETTEASCNPFLHYPKFAVKFNTVAAKSPAKAKFYSPLLSHVPLRKRRLLRRAVRRYSRISRPKH